MRDILTIPSSQVVATANGVVQGSGAEDIGFKRFESVAIAKEYEHIAAEREARNRRLDRDRIIAVAVDLLEIEAIDRSVTSDGMMLYIAGAANIVTSRFSSAQETIDYISGLLADIRSELSPIVRG